MRERPISPRSAFDDYAVFVNTTLYLWVCERHEGVPDPEDPNQDAVVGEKQVQVEHAEAVWMRHLRVRALAAEPQSSLREIARLEEELWRLTRYGRENSNYGEIWRFLEYVAEQHGVSDVRAHIQEGLRLRSVVLEEHRSHRQQWFGTLLSVLLGIGAAETLTDRVLVPLVKLQGLEVSPDTPWLNVASFMLIGAAVLGVWFATLGRKLRV